MSFESSADLRAIENEMTWEERGMPATMYQFLTATKDSHGSRPAVSYQIFSGPTDHAETLTWNDLHGKTTQAANLFRSLGVEEGDTVAYLLPNANETVVTLLGGSVAGIVNPINPLLEPDHISAILRQTGVEG